MKTSTPVFIGLFLCLVLSLTTHAQNLTVEGKADIKQRIDVGTNDNTFVGRNAGLNAQAGSNGNTFIGQAAGLNDTIGIGNVFVGESSGVRSNANDNTFIGRTSGLFNTSGHSNTFLGKSAGFLNQTGLENTFLGIEAGSNSFNSTRNTFIGSFASALTSDSLDRAIAIGYDANVNCSNCAVIGGTGFNAVNLGINNNAPEARLHLNGNLRVDGGQFQSIGPLTFQPDIDATGDDRVNFLDNTGAPTMTINENGDVEISRGTAENALTRSLTLLGARNAEFQASSKIDFNNYDDDASATNYTGARIASFNATADDAGDLRFFTKNDLGFFEQMRISERGNVGIGTLTPQAKLSINGGTDVKLVGGGGFLILGDTLGLNMGLDNNEMQARNNGAASDLRIQNEGGNTLISPGVAGNVGIGRTNPQAKLHIGNGTEVTLTDGGNAIFGDLDNVNMGIDNNELQVRNNGAAATLFLQNEGGNTLINPNGSGTVAINVVSPNAGSVLHTSGNVRMANLPILSSGSNLIIDSDGDIGIEFGSITANAARIETLEQDNQELQTQLAQLKAANEALNNRLAKIEAMLSSSTNEVNTTTTTLTSATLAQNAPNPFTEATTISYFIPEGIKNAELRIMNVQGSVIKTIPIQATGHGQVALQAHTLNAGAYSYSLILDGQVMATKQMVLTR
ncbi:MAG: hypothetical protein AAGI23_01810 [Bacteroidota bacterium]